MSRAACLFASANFDGLAQALAGAALLFVGVATSVPLALVHLGRAFFAPGESSFRRLRILWLVTAGCTALGAALLAVGGADKHVVPYLPVAALAPLVMAAAAGRASCELRAGGDLEPFDLWSNRLAPLVWLAILADFVIRVFPRT